MIEARPRMTRAELEYLMEALKDREEALKALYERLIRITVFKASEASTWREAVFKNFRIHGERGLNFFRQGRAPDCIALDNEMRTNETVLRRINREVWITKGLRARFESLLKGKKKGRISLASDMARDYLRTRKRAQA